MSLLARIVGLDGLDIKRRGAWLVVGGVFATLFAALAIAALSVAGFMALTEHMTAMEAVLVIAAIAFVVVAVIVAITLRMVRRARAEIAGAMRASAVATIAPAAVSLVTRKVGMAGAVALLVAGLAYVEGRRRV